jgi:hypothetical protein
MVPLRRWLYLVCDDDDDNDDAVNSMLPSRPDLFIVLVEEEDEEEEPRERKLFARSVDHVSDCIHGSDIALDFYNSIGYNMMW